VLLDTQFVTSHLAQFGAFEMPRAQYKATLDRAAATPAVWRTDLDAAALEAEIRSMSGKRSAKEQ